MTAVLEFADVTVRRGKATLVESIYWTVDEDERWVILGPNGAGKTTLLQVASAQIHPTSGVVGILGEVLGTVDVFDLRPRIGITSAAVAERIPRDEPVHDVVVSASYGVVGRWRECYDDLDHERAEDLLTEVGVKHLAGPHLRHPERGRAQAGADRAGPDDRPRAAAPRRARGRTRPRRPRGPRVDAVVLANDEYSPATVLVSHHVEEIPPGFTHVLLLRDGRVVAAGAIHDVVTEEHLSATFGMPLRLEPRGRPVRGTAPNPPTAGLVTPADRVPAWSGSGRAGVAGSLRSSSACSRSFSLDLILIMLAVGALVGMITAALGGSCGGSGAGGRGDLRRHARPGPAEPDQRLTRAPSSGSDTAS